MLELRGGVIEQQALIDAQTGCVGGQKATDRCKPARAVAGRRAARVMSQAIYNGKAGLVVC